MNKIRLLGIFIIITSVYIQYSSEDNNFSFLLGVIMAIGITMLLTGKFNIFKKEKAENKK